MSNNFEKISPESNDAKKLLLSELNNALNEDDSIPDAPSAEFDEDAAEGLQQIEAAKIPQLVSQINSNLSAQLKNKKKGLPKIPDQSMVIMTVVTLLILLIITFLVVKRLL